MNSNIFSILKMNSSVLCLLLCIGLSLIGSISASSDNLGPLKLALKLLKCDLSRNLNLDVSDINVHFYDFKNGVSEVFPIHNAAKDIMSLKKFDKKKKLFMFVSGFNSYINQTNAEKVRNTFKNVPNSYLIIIDHSPYTNDWEGKKKSYERSVKHVYYIGIKLAQMLVGLQKLGISPKNIHCIGHSLGSQILGHVGENFFNETGKKIARITALDPAGPCFSNSLVQEQIRSGVAEYVEIYHCNSGGLGSSSVLGDIDFFVNKGRSQPNCVTKLVPNIIDATLSANCDHKMCISMWMESVAHSDQYTAYKCENYELF